MDFTGNLMPRYFTSVKQLSFMLENFSTNAIETFNSGNPNSGNGLEIRFGLTGIPSNTGWYFAFRNGKIIDPDGRVFYAYDDGEAITLSGNISTGAYDYYVNNELVCSLGTKSNFDVNGWYVQMISGATGVGNVYIHGSSITTTLTFQTSFISGTSWSGTFSHNNNGPLVIRSGELRMTDANQFQISGTGLSFNNGTNVVVSGGSLGIRLNHTGLTSRTGLYVVGVRVYTDFGPSDFVISGSGTSPSNTIVSNNLYTDVTGDITPTGSGFSYSQLWYYNTYATTLSGTPLTKPIYLELSYFSGATGNFSRVTGFNITNSGTGYVGPVYAVVTPSGGGYPIASGTGILGGASTGISSITWLTTGYYTGITGGYAITFTMISGRFASGTPVFSPAYVKTFTGQTQFMTGVFSSGTSGIACATGVTFFSGNTTLATGENLVVMNIIYTGTPDSANFRYLVKASGLADSITSISIYSGSGLMYRT